MDKVKKFFKEHKEHLSLEDINEAVWKGVHKAIRPEKKSLKNFKSFFKKQHWFSGLKEREVKYTLSSFKTRMKWSFAILLPVLFFFSCTYRVSRLEVIGTIISFNLNKDNIYALQKLNLLQGFHDFKAVENNISNEKQLSFIGFVKPVKKKLQNIKNDLAKLPTISQVKEFPVRAKINESLFSAFVHKAFNIHVDARRPKGKELEDIIREQLLNYGLKQVVISVTSNRLELRVDTSYPSIPVIKQDSSVASIPVVIESSRSDNLKQTLTTENRLPIKTAYLNYDEFLSKNPEIKIGTWKGSISDDTILIKFNDPRPHASGEGWVATRKFSLSEVGISNPDGNLMFSIQREPGFIHFKGTFTKNNAEGFYASEGNVAFKDFLVSNGFPEPNKDAMLLLFLMNATRKYIQLLKENGLTDISSNQWYRMGVKGVTSKYVEDYLSFLQKHKYKNITPETLISLKENNVTTSYINSFLELGYKDISLDMAKYLKNHGVEASFIEQLFNMGYKGISLEFAKQLVDHGVNVQFLKGLAELGYKNVPLDKVLGLKYQGITTSLIKSYQQLGFSDLTLDKILRMKVNGVTPGYIQNLRAKGKNLSIDDYIKFKQEN